MCDHAVDGESPVSKLRSLKAFELVIQWLDLVREWRLGDLAPREFASEGMPREQPLRSVVEGFAEAIESAVIGWDQPIPLRKACGYSQARCAGCGREPGSDQFAA